MIRRHDFPVPPLPRPSTRLDGCLAPHAAPFSPLKSPLRPHPAPIRRTPGAPVRGSRPAGGDGTAPSDQTNVAPPNAPPDLNRRKRPVSRRPPRRGRAPHPSILPFRPPSPNKLPHTPQQAGIFRLSTPTGRLFLPSSPKSPHRPVLTSTGNATNRDSIRANVFEEEREGVRGRGRGNFLQKVSPSPPQCSLTLPSSQPEREPRRRRPWAARRGRRRTRRRRWPRPRRSRP